MLLVALPASEVNGLLAAAHGGDLTATVDLAAQTVRTADGRTFLFEYDPFRKSCLLNGYDDIDYLLSHHEAIKVHFSRKDPVRL